MKKTLAVLMAALLAAVCFATIGSAATISASLNEDYADVTATKDLSKLFDGVTYVEKNEITEGADAWKTDGSAYTQGDIVLFMNAKATDKTAGTKLVLNIDLGEAKDLDSVVVYFNQASEGGDVSSDESKDESVNESAAESTEAPVTSSGTSSAADSSTPSTGDAGVIAVVVLAVAAVIGAAVIVKKRA